MTTVLPCWPVHQSRMMECCGQDLSQYALNNRLFFLRRGDVLMTLQLEVWRQRGEVLKEVRTVCVGSRFTDVPGCRTCVSRCACREGYCAQVCVRRANPTCVLLVERHCRNRVFAVFVVVPPKKAVLLLGRCSFADGVWS